MEPMDDMDLDEEPQTDQFQTIPPYQMLLGGLKNLTMTMPRMHQIEGFRLSVGTPISHNFVVQHEFNLTPEAKPVSQQMLMMGMGPQKLPFY